MNTTEATDWVDKIGKPAFESIEEMVGALGVDYDRLEELKESVGDSIQGDYDPEEVEELKELQDAAGDCTDQDEALKRIEEDPLSIEIGGWWTPDSEAEASEYRILLATGGPAVRIVGTLDQYNMPETAQLEVQDWFKPWTEYHCDEEILLAYVNCLYFGD